MFYVQVVSSFNLRGIFNCQLLPYGKVNSTVLLCIKLIYLVENSALYEIRSNFYSSRPPFTLPASWLREGKGELGRSHRHALLRPSARASSRGTPSSLPAGRRSSTALPRLAPLPPGRVGCVLGAFAATRSHLQMDQLPPAVLWALPVHRSPLW